MPCFYFILLHIINIDMFHLFVLFIICFSHKNVESMEVWFFFLVFFFGFFFA